MSFRSKVFEIHNKFQKPGGFPIYCMAKWAGGYKLSTNMTATI